MSNGYFYYLCVIRGRHTKQILAHQVSDSLTVDFVLLMMEDLKNNHEKHLDPNAIIHSNQGVHFTSIAFREFFKKDKTAEASSLMISIGTIILERKIIHPSSPNFSQYLRI